MTMSTNVSDEKKTIKPGGRNYGAGAKKGTKYKKTKEWEEFGRSILEKGMPRFLSILETSEDKDFTIAFTQILEYFKPKLARVDNSNSGEVTLIIKKEVIQPEDGSQNK